MGNAQFYVLVDGYIVGNGANTATASHAAGQVNLDTFTGSWGSGPHNVSVAFLNSANGGTPTTSRDLYVNSVNYDGTAIAMSPIEETSNGIATISVPATSLPAAPSVFTLDLSEDAYQGDAQFIVSIDGTILAGAQSVTASHSAGASQAFTFSDVLAAGNHNVGVTFLNAAGSGSTERSLYVVGASLNGTAQSPANWTAALHSNGTDYFGLTVPSHS